jgi:hypothetical protein
MREPLALLDKDLAAATVEPTILTTQVVAVVEPAALVEQVLDQQLVEQVELDCNLELVEQPHTMQVAVVAVHRVLERLLQAD